MRPTAVQLLSTIAASLRESGELPRPQSTQVLEGADLHVGYGDDGPVFRVTVEEVPRFRWVPGQPIAVGPVEGVVAQLVAVTVDNFVHVQLAAAPSAERDRLLAEHEQAFRHWAETAAPTPGSRPENPALRLRHVQLAIDDGLGTRYELAAAQYGGTGSEWDGQQSFRPRPPASAGQLALTLQVPGGPAVRVPVPLPGAEQVRER